MSVHINTQLYMSTHINTCLCTDKCTHLYMSTHISMHMRSCMYTCKMQTVIACKRAFWEKWTVSRHQLVSGFLLSISLCCSHRREGLWWKAFRSARASKGSVRACSGLHPPKWAPTHGPYSHAPCGWAPDRWVGEGTPDHLEPGHSAWYLVGTIHFSCLIRIFYPFHGWGGEWFMVSHCRESQMYMCLCACMLQVHPPPLPSPQIIASMHRSLTVCQACVLHMYYLIYST